MKETSRHYWATTEPAKPPQYSCSLVSADVAFGGDENGSAEIYASVIAQSTVK